MESIGVRELRQNASVYLRRVAAGERFTITDRGVPVAELGAVSTSPLQRLVDEGVVIPSGEPFTVDGLEPVGLPDGSPTASETLRAMRDAERS